MGSAKIRQKAKTPVEGCRNSITIVYGQRIDRGIRGATKGVSLCRTQNESFVARNDVALGRFPGSLAVKRSHFLGSQVPELSAEIAR